MATDLTAVFGTEICVADNALVVPRIFTGYPGAHGMTSMYLGSRGYPLIVTGTLAAAGGDYAAARAAVQTIITDLDDYILAEPADYSYQGVTYYDVVIERIDYLRDAAGKMYHYTSEGYCVVKFIAHLRALI